RRGLVGASRRRRRRSELEPGGVALVAVAHGPVAPQLREAGGLGLLPQRLPAGVLGLVVEVVRDARLLDAPAGRRSDAHAAQAPLHGQGDDLVDAQAEQLRHLGGVEVPRTGGRVLGHALIIARRRCGPPPRRGAVDNRRGGRGGSVTMGGMSSVESARPRRRAFWADARVFLGPVLGVASVAGVWLLVTASRRGVPVLAATA